MTKLGWIAGTGIYIFTDALYDLFMIELPFPFGEILYFGRHAVVISLMTWKLWKLHVQKTKQPPAPAGQDSAQPKSAKLVSQNPFNRKEVKEKRR